jgi:glycine dehydrogenase subunit 2
MKETMGTTGLILDEPLLWEKGKPGRTGTGPDFPDLSEVDLVRHYTRLSTWNFSVDTGMYPLGSCTMKYNPKVNEKQATLPGFANAHPMLPKELCQGALKLMYELERFLAEITGMDAVTLQPAAGAHGELTGMLLIHAYHKGALPRFSSLIQPMAQTRRVPLCAAISLCLCHPMKTGSFPRTPSLRRWTETRRGS